MEGKALLICNWEPALLICLIPGKRKQPAPSIPKKIKQSNRSLKKTPRLLETSVHAMSTEKPLMLWFEDEAKFGRINNLSRCWVVYTDRPVVTKQMIREYVYAYTAVCPYTGNTFSIISPLNNTYAMNIFPELLSAEYSEYNIVMVLDGAGWHTSHMLKIPGNINLLHLTPYSPELNPVEHIWDYIREQKGFNNHPFDTIQQVEDHLVSALKEISQENSKMKSLCSFYWIN